MERKQSIRTEKIKHDSLKIGNEQKRKTKEKKQRQHSISVKALSEIL